jgi:hypothetical protein
VGGRFPRRSSGDTGTRAMCAWINPSGSLPSNGRAPVSAKYSVAPSAYKSLRESTPRPMRPDCSGAMYWGSPAKLLLPAASPALAAAAPSGRAMANPMRCVCSVAGFTSTCSGRTSRCSSRASCRHASEFASWIAISRNAAGEGSAAAVHPHREGACTRSSTSTGPPAAVTSSRACTISGPAARRSASYSRAARERPSTVSSRRYALSTTLRPSLSRTPACTSQRELARRHFSRA